MKHLLFIITLMLAAVGCEAQRYVNPHIPHTAILYNSHWKGVKTIAKATYYRVTAIDDNGRRMFYDYYINGKLRAEKHYRRIDKHDDRLTVLDGVCRTFHPSGRVESIMTYRNGKANGRAVSFFPSGSVGMKLNYRNGLLDGTCYTYSERGRLEVTTVWQRGNKISERKGGRDKYISRQTNKDVFCDDYRKDEPLIIAQARHIDNLMSGKPAKAVASKPKTVASKPKTVASKPKTEAAKRGKPNKTIAQKQPKPRPSLSEAFDYLAAIMQDADHRRCSQKMLDGVGSAYGLESVYTINGYGSQREKCYAHNMTYDTATGKDIVGGQQPRQIAFSGAEAANGTFIVTAISIYTDSRQEMTNIAKKAISRGMQTIGGVDYASADGNFTLRSVPQDISYSDAMMITFTHQPGVYAGLYHIRLQCE